jgi:MerR HTH family regulatory protein
MTRVFPEPGPARTIAGSSSWSTARILGVHENTVRNWEKRGVLRAARLPGSEYRRFDRGEIERMRAEMFSQLAPATQGPTIQPRRSRRGRLVQGDDTE